MKKEGNRSRVRRRPSSILVHVARLSLKHRLAQFRQETLESFGQSFVGHSLGVSREAELDGRLGVQLFPLAGRGFVHQLFVLIRTRNDR